MDILSIIKQIEEDKKSRHIIPEHALITEILVAMEQYSRCDVLLEINRLCDWGIAYVGETINDQFVKIL